MKLKLTLQLPIKPRTRGIRGHHCQESHRAHIPLTRMHIQRTRRRQTALSPLAHSTPWKKTLGYCGPLYNITCTQNSATIYQNITYGSQEIQRLTEGSPLHQCQCASPLATHKINTVTANPLCSQSLKRLDDYTDPTSTNTLTTQISR